MVFGDKREFAIEAETIALRGKWIFGRLQIWIAYAAFGDFEDTADLAGSARAGRLFLAASASRTRADLDLVGPERVYWLLYGRFFERGGSVATEEFHRDTFLVDDIGDAAVRDRVSILAVRRGDGRDRMLIRDHGTGRLAEHLVGSGACDEAVDGYCRWVEDIPF